MTQPVLSLPPQQDGLNNITASPGPIGGWAATLNFSLLLTNDQPAWIDRWLVGAISGPRQRASSSPPTKALQARIQDGHRSTLHHEQHSDPSQLLPFEARKLTVPIVVHAATRFPTEVKCAIYLLVEGGTVHWYSLGFEIENQDRPGGVLVSSPRLQLESNELLPVLVKN